MKSLFKTVATGFLLCGLYLNSAVLVASEIADDSGWQAWPIVGEASLSWGFWTIYDSQLATPDGQYLGSAGPLALKITYRRDIDGEDLLDATGDQWEHLGYQLSEYQPWVKELGTVFPNVKKGDQLIYTLNNGVGIFYFRENRGVPKVVGKTSSSDMADAFSAIWLSPDTSYPNLRLALIGKK
ncbi:chalcone isomerase family protein [Veronia pacifica]|uniref:Uncharacterized protein n=1 Tax=Veronia pacifica TaxID=1080227 RepID=A0A1C3EAM3_9GAMM|nr:chalcone isomerase family protein [Veronia pacifica]ODA30278.1 hypothetical protein A8L45_20625 [Veronia pacifica]